MSTEVMISKTETIQHLYKLFGEGNIPAIVDKLSDNVVWDSTRNPIMPGARLFNGKQDVILFFQMVGETFIFHAFEPLNFFETGNKLFVIGRFDLEYKNDHRRLTVDWTMRWIFNGGEIVGFAEYYAPID